MKLEGIVSSAEDLNVPSGEYDIVYAANLIHHVSDRARLFEQIKRALKPGGTFFSWDPLAYNPAIYLYRKMATEVRTEDERPLTIRDVELARRYFPALRHREFWVASLLLFVKYYLKDRVHPNDQRYWKRILRETSENLGWWMPLRSRPNVDANSGGSLASLECRHVGPKGVLVGLLRPAERQQTVRCLPHWCTQGVTPRDGECCEDGCSSDRVNNVLFFEPVRAASGYKSVRIGGSDA